MTPQIEMKVSERKKELEAALSETRAVFKVRTRTLRCRYHLSELTVSCALPADREARSHRVGAARVRPIGQRLTETYESSRRCWEVSALLDPESTALRTLTGFVGVTMVLLSVQAASRGENAQADQQRSTKADVTAREAYQGVGTEARDAVRLERYAMRHKAIWLALPVLQEPTLADLDKSFSSRAWLSDLHALG